MQSLDSPCFCNSGKKFQECCYLDFSKVSPDHKEVVDWLVSLARWYKEWLSRFEESPGKIQDIFGTWYHFQNPELHKKLPDIGDAESLAREMVDEGYLKPHPYLLDYCGFDWEMNEVYTELFGTESYVWYERI